jgi:hypothetical protein
LLTFLNSRQLKPSFKYRETAANLKKEVILRSDYLEPYYSALYSVQVT